MIEIANIIIDQNNIKMIEKETLYINIFFKDGTDKQLRDYSDEIYEKLKQLLIPKKRKVYAKIYHPRKAPRSKRNLRIGKSAVVECRRRVANE